MTIILAPGSHSNFNLSSHWEGETWVEERRLEEERGARIDPGIAAQKSFKFVQKTQQSSEVGVVKKLPHWRQWHAAVIAALVRQKQESSWACWPISLSKLLSFRFNHKPCLNKKVAWVSCNKHSMHEKSSPYTNAQDECCAQRSREVIGTFEPLFS